ncbi:hypothetical protein [Flavivirga algicola]|uniref:Uncharacterized protein n=1 Tax=Flavivirga algicola TaxID=2729136 RepID=A0ABX1S0I1_9FLAO|nr:hypothetical protein [Flavivirga algicola]NMH88528.1 hypothetical protein [Flavivirga algicola]
MKQIILVWLVCSSSVGFSQEKLPDQSINGTYHLLFAEQGSETKTKLFQFGENNGVKLLAIAACEKCIPAIYTYQPEASKKLGVRVFLNNLGLYVIGYDEESFIIVLVKNKLGNGVWNDFSFSNFYSKNKGLVKSMTKEKIKAYAISLSKK